MDFDVSPFLPLLDRLEWHPAGDPGTFAMLDIPEWFPAHLIYDAALPRYPGKRVGKMACLSRLVPGQAIPQHIDAHDGHCRQRIHAPLVTDPGAIFVHTVDARLRAVHMEAGRLYEIDPTQPHSVCHGGTVDRIHLFFNVVD